MKDRKYLKRFLAFVLSAAMVLTYMPMSMLAFAEDGAAEAASGEAKATEAVEEKSEPAPVEKAAAEPKAAAEEKSEPAPAAEKESEPAPAAAEEAAPAVSEEKEGTAEEAASDTTEAVTEEQAEETDAEAAEKEEKDDLEYPADTFKGSAGGVSVVIEAPKGALPKGTKLDVTAVAASEVQDAVEGAIGAEAAKIKAVDITFVYEGKKIEPKRAVIVHLNVSGIDSEADKKVVHIADNGAANVVTENVTSDGAASFSAKDFSIYLVVEEDETNPEQNAVATYEFYVEGELVQTQYLKTGDKPVDPGVMGADEANTVFKGWYIGDTAVNFDEALDVPETTTVRVDAKIEHTYYVTFWGEPDDEGNRGIAAVKSVTVEGTESGTVTTDDVTVTPKADTSAFKGWAEDEEGTTMAGSTVKVSGRMDLYAVIVQAHWIHFYENVPEDADSDATYTGPVYVAEDETRSSKKPADPTRKGYTFGGWYLEESCETEFDWTQTGLDKDTDVYAKWIPGEADFTIIVWKQKVTDAKDAADDAKTYDFELSAPWTGTTDETVDLNQFEMYKELEFTGFHYGRMEAKPETVKADGSTVVNVYYDRNLLTIRFVDGTETVYQETTSTSTNPQKYGLVDGEYVQLDRHGNNASNYYWTYDEPRNYSGTTYRQANNNQGTQYGFVNGQMVELTYHQQFFGGYWTYGNNVRYNGTRYLQNATGNSGYGIVDGEVVGISNQNGQWIYTEEVRYTGTRYQTATQPHTDEYTGLYGSTLAANGYTWPGERAWYQNPNSGGTRLTFLDAFKFEGLSGTSENNTVLTQYGANQSGNNYIRFYKQNIDGSYPAANSPTDRIRSGGGTFTITEKYEGFKAVQYAHGGGWNNGGAGTSTSATDLQIRFERQKFSLTLMSEDAEFDTVTGIPYEDVLSKHKPTAEPTKAHYDFVGWYEDPTGQTEFDWSSTMPAANKVVYAKFTPKTYHVSLDPNGGEFQNAQVGEFNVPLDTILDKTSLTQNVALAGHELVGWFDAETGQPYGYGKIEEDVSLVAKWRYPGQVAIVYDPAPNGSGEPEDNYKYATDSSVVLGAPPETIDEGYAFIAWSVGGKKYYTNNAFELTEDLLENAEYDDSTKVYTLTITAIYQQLGTGPLTPTTITYKANGGTGDDVVVPVDPDTLLVNQPIKAKSVDDCSFTRDGYEFTGWNTMEDGSGLDVAAGDDIAADREDLENNTKINTLYAQWVKLDELTYDKNASDATGTMDPATGRSGTAVEVADNGFTRTGYEFTGWNTKADGSGKDYTAGDDYTLVADQDDILYAQWESTTQEVSVKITGTTKTVEFNGATQMGDPNYTLTWYLDGEEVSEAPEGVSFDDRGYKCPSGKDAKTYEGTISGTIVVTDSSKYTIPAGGGVTTDKSYLTITPAPLVVKLTGNTDTVEYNGKVHTVTGLTFEVEGLKGSDTKDLISISGESAASVQGTDADTYPMNMKADDYRAILPNGNNNYTTSVEIAKDGWLKITPAKVTITITGNKATETYDGTEKSVEGYTATSDSKLFDDSKVSLDGEAVAKGTDIGKYPMSLDASKFSYDDKNVEATFNVTDGELEILSNEVEITYDLNGGEYNGSTANIVETHKIGEEITIHEAPTREGYEFLYWKGSEYQPGDKYTVTEDHTFVAQWKAAETPTEEPDDSDNDSGKDTGKDSSKKSTGVKTGDESDIMGLLGLMGASIVGFIALFFRRRREQE